MASRRSKPDRPAKKAKKTNQPKPASAAPAAVAPAEEGTVEDLLAFLRKYRGFDFDGYKRSSLVRRIRKRMGDVRVRTYADYIDFLQVHPEEFSHLFNTILINVTAFFRDPQAWQFLREEVIPRIVSNKKPDDPIRVWSAGCSSGEEPYSIAMLLAEHLGLDAFIRRVKVYATDIDEESLTQARLASYSARSVAAVPAPLLEKYFDHVGSRYVVQKELRRGVIFGRHDLLQDAPISRVDLLLCRNTIMYFGAEAQAQSLERLHFARRGRRAVPREGRDAAHAGEPVHACSCARRGRTATAPSRA